MISLLRQTVAACILAAGAATSAAAQSSYVIDFEDLVYGRAPGAAVEWGGGSILSSYAGFEWTNLRPLDLQNYTFQPAGYPRGGPTGDVLGLAFAPVTMAGSSPFILRSGVFGSGWTDPTSFTVTGFFGAETQFTRTVNLTTSGPLFIDFGEVLVTEVLFTPDFLPTGYADTFESGQYNAGTPYQSFYADNLSVTANGGLRVTTTPEPATLLLTGGGLVGLMATRLRRRRRTA
jgi:hypothetical protein